MISQEAKVWLKQDGKATAEYHDLSRLVISNNLPVLLRP